MLLTGIAGVSKADNTPFTTLMYATGSKDNYHYNLKDGLVKRRNPVEDNTTSFSYHQQAAVLTDEALHDGGDVAVYAMGKTF